MKKKSAGRGKSQAQRLRAELVEAIEGVDEAGLIFLLQQAQVLLHNARVDTINREIAELQERDGGAAAGQVLPVGGGAAVRIDEADDRKTFFATLGEARKALSLAEMRQLVKICYAAESKSAALRQLYTYLSRERSDILADAHIGGAGSPLIEGLFQALRASYRLQDR